MKILLMYGMHSSGDIIVCTYFIATPFKIFKLIVTSAAACAAQESILLNLIVSCHVTPPPLLYNTRTVIDYPSAIRPCALVPLVPSRHFPFTFNLSDSAKLLPRSSFHFAAEEILTENNHGKSSLKFPALCRFKSPAFPSCCRLFAYK